MKFIYRMAATIVLGIAVLGLAACEQGPAESAGANIDSAAKQASDQLREASDKVKEAVQGDDKN
mgnify:CR=1 FL=1